MPKVAERIEIEYIPIATLIPSEYKLIKNINKAFCLGVVASNHNSDRAMLKREFLGTQERIDGSDKAGYNHSASTGNKHNFQSNINKILADEVLS